MLIVRSPVRISFGGGGTDLPAYYEQFGGAVLSAAINKYFYTILGKRSDDRIQVISSDLRVFETWRDIANMSVSGNALEIPLAVLKEVHCDTAIDLFLASEIPPGTGLGSSASVCVNILKTLTTYLQRPLSKYNLAKQAFHIARNVLGKHIGKRFEYAAAFGGLNYISFHPDDNELRSNRSNRSPQYWANSRANLMLFFTGAAHSSWTILREQEKLHPGGKGRGQSRGIARSERRSAEVCVSPCKPATFVSSVWNYCMKAGTRSAASRPRSPRRASTNCTRSHGNMGPWGGKSRERAVVASSYFIANCHISRRCERPWGLRAFMR